MNHAQGTTEMTSPEPSDVNHLLEIDEADIRLLLPYDGESDGHTLVGLGESDGRTLVGLGPVSREVAVEKAENGPGSLQPTTQPAGAWGSADETMPASLRGKKLGLWGVATPLLLVVAGVAVVVLRALGGPAQRATPAQSVAPVVERSDASLAVELKNADVHVFLDGQDRGQPPLLLSGLTPGSHSLAILGPSYAPFEQPVTLVNDHTSTIEPKLDLVRGAINLTAGKDADGARVEVIGGGERRELTTLPLKLEAAPGEYEIRAKKLGFPPFETSVTLSPATPEVAVVVELGKTRSGAVHGATAAAANTDANGANGESTATSGTASSGAATSGTGSLNITSSPPASVVLDGRPLGKAPRVVDVPAGTHTVVFIHPKYGRQSVTVNAVPGRTTSASADF